ncbi:cation diffusion facilitator family transporter [Thalassotalea agarivorans]|uniref:Ferrous-iron efflux pump FieF n=1 Tax=Thalassotalea agarivorans TaxID=349064 RepID=A0A1I0HRZ1_THASX|nr:cation diffusion facilitator family transporter [Thalassotalea agarivorans]SET86073.1 ferrous-iron efflux pump FieF [Thalassotalea agarivorans]
MTQHSRAENQYQFWVKLAARAAVVIALLFVVIKLWAFYRTNSGAMLASATDSVLDLFASAVNLIVLRIALSPADDNHRFGHGKAESLAGLLQSAFVLGSAFLLVISGIERLLNPAAIANSGIGIGVTLFTIVMTLALVVLQKLVINKTQSVAISADSLHYQSDLLLNLGVLVSLYLSAGIWLYADGIFTCFVGLLLAFNAFNIIRLSVNNLMDKELAEGDRNRINDIANQHDSTIGIHELRTRQSGEICFIQFHLELPDSLSLSDAHSISVEIEQMIKAEFHPCEVLIHQDPTSVVAKELADNERAT